MSDRSPIGRMISRQVRSYWIRFGEGWSAEKIARHLGYPVQFVVTVIFGPVGFMPTFPYMGWE